MPNRILRDWTDSLTLCELSAEGERFFTRLIMKADDFGRFHGDERLLKAALFPLLTDIRQTKVRQWRDECVTAKLVTLYQDARGREYIEIHNFNQRTRAKESKYPDPSEGIEQPPDGQMTDTCQSHDRHMRTETETETYSETRDGDGRATKKVAKASKARGSLDEIKEFCKEIELPDSDADYLYHHWTSNDWINGNKKIKDWKATVRAWKAAGYLPSQKNGNNKHRSGFGGRNQGTANEGSKRGSRDNSSKLLEGVQLPSQ